LAGSGDDRGQIGGGEPQMLAQERAGHLPQTGLAAQPRLPHPQQHRGLGRGVEQLAVVVDRRQ
jgi:hypothetical protein